MKRQSINILIGGLFTALLIIAPAASASVLDGKLKLVNNRQVPVTLNIDGRRQILIGAYQKRIINNVPNGVRMLRLSSQGIRDTFRKVTVPVQGKAKVRLNPLQGRAAITNRSGIKMRLFAANRLVAKIGPWKTFVTPPMPPGTFVFKAMPAGAFANSAPGIVHRVTIRAFEKTQVTLAKYLATIRVKNPFTRPAALMINGTYAAKIEAGQTLKLNRQLPGSKRLTLSLKRRIQVSTRIHAGIGKTISWKPLPPRRGTLSVTNRSARPVALTIDRMSLGTIAPGQTRRFRNLPAGPHRLVKHTPRGFKVKRHIVIPENQRLELTLRQHLPRVHRRVARAKRRMGQARPIRVAPIRTQKIRVSPKPQGTTVMRVFW